MSKLVEHTKKKLNYAYELRKAVSNVKYPDVLYKDQIDDIKKKALTMVDVVIEKQEAEFIESIVSSTSRPETRTCSDCKFYKESMCCNDNNKEILPSKTLPENFGCIRFRTKYAF